MDVLIKDSSLPPTNCYGCRFFKEEHYKDVFQDREYDVIGECLAGEFQIEKPYSPYDGICPLVELPPHGRLIDADELLASDAIDWGEEAWYGIKNAPTVLEANYGSDN